MPDPQFLNETETIRISSEDYVRLLKGELNYIERKIRSSGEVSSNLTELEGQYRSKQRNDWVEKIREVRSDIPAESIVDVAHKVPLAQAIFLKWITGMPVKKDHGDVVRINFNDYMKNFESSDVLEIKKEAMNVRLYDELPMIIRGIRRKAADAGAILTAVRSVFTRLGMEADFEAIFNDVMAEDTKKRGTTHKQSAGGLEHNSKGENIR